MFLYKVWITSKSFTSVCGETLFDSMLSFSSRVFDSILQTRLAAAKSPSVVFAMDNSSKDSLWLNASKMAINCFSDTGTLFKFTFGVL